MAIKEVKRVGKTKYKAVIYDHSGKQISKSFERKIDAKDWQNERWLEAKKGNVIPVDFAQKTMRDCMREWLEEFGKVNLEQSSVLRYQRMFKYHIDPEFGCSVVKRIDRESVVRWFRALREKKKFTEKTCNETLSFFKRLFTFAVRKKYCPLNTAIDIPNLRASERPYDFWTLEESRKFLAYLKNAEPRFYYICLIALTTGLRLGEIVALKWDAVALDRGQICVRRIRCLETGGIKDTTKNKRIRFIPINNTLRTALVELAQGVSGAGQNGFVVDGTDSYHFSTKLRRHAALAKVKGIRFHDLRHSFASQFMMAGGRIYDLQRLLGHTTVQMTERYSHLSPQHLQGVTECLTY